METGSLCIAKILVLLVTYDGLLGLDLVASWCENLLSLPVTDHLCADISNRKLPA
jgi:hypothetical protein